MSGTTGDACSLIQTTRWSFTSVKEKYLPLTGFKYSELETGAYAKLDPCPSCTPVKRKSVIDEQNIARGAVTPEEVAASATEPPASEEPEETAAQTPEETDSGGSSGGVQITIMDAE